MVSLCTEHPLSPAKFWVVESHWVLTGFGNHVV